MLWLTTDGEVRAAVSRTGNVIGDQSLTEAVRGAEVTVTLLTLTRMEPIDGRLLGLTYERPGAAPTRRALRIQPIDALKDI